MAALALADDYWMTAHDQTNGSCYLQPKPLGMGLAAALLCELILTKWIDVENDNLYLHPDTSMHLFPPDDPAGRAVMEGLLSRAEIGRHGYPGHFATLSVDSEIRQLENGQSQSFVEQRLLQADPPIVEEEQRGRLFRSARTFLRPTDRNMSGWPATRIKRRLYSAEALDEQDLVLAGLLIATGLESRVLSDLGGRERAFLGQQTQTRLRRPLVQLLISAETAIARLVMTR